MNPLYVCTCSTFPIFCILLFCEFVFSILDMYFDIFFVLKASKLFRVVSWISQWKARVDTLSHLFWKQRMKILQLLIVYVRIHEWRLFQKAIQNKHINYDGTYTRLNVCCTYCTRTRSTRNCGNEIIVPNLGR